MIQYAEKEIKDGETLNAKSLLESLNRNLLLKLEKCPDFIKEDLQNLSLTISGMLSKINERYSPKKSKIEI